MTIKGFWYENAFAVSFAPETEESDIYDGILVTIDNAVYECGMAEIIPIHTNSDNQVETYLICLDSDKSEVKDPSGIAFILDIPSETMTFKDKDGYIYAQAIAMVKNPEGGQIMTIWGDPCERDVVSEWEISDIVEMSDNPDETARTRAIQDNLENLIVE